MVIVDHHQPHKSLDGACAFINPKREDCDYPFSDLSSAALSFKLLQALKKDSCHSVLDLVALSVVCDVVPIKGENRVLLNEGLKLLKDTSRLPIKARSALANNRSTSSFIGAHFSGFYII